MNHPCDTMFTPNLAIFIVLLYTLCFLLWQFLWDSSFLFVHLYELLRKTIYLLHTLLEWPPDTHLCTVTKLPCQSYLLWVFFPPESGLSLTEYSQTGGSTQLHYPFTTSFPQCACQYHTQQQCRKSPSWSLERLALKLEAVQLISCGFASGFLILLLSSAADGSTAFVSESAQIWC